jgi:hypothetical protein
MRPCSGVRCAAAPRSSGCSRSRCTFGKPVHIGYDQSGSFFSGYCDVVLPSSDYTNTAKELIYTDLYIDVVVRADYSVYTKDQEVFDRAAMRFPIVEQSRKKSFEVLDWLEGQAKSWTGPFELIPRLLPRTDFEKLNPDEASASLRSVLNGQSDDTGRTS